MRDRPWTPGPWHFHEHETHTGELRYQVCSDDDMLIHDYCELSPTDGDGWIDPTIPATGELITLAPIMAEAIIAYADGVRHLRSKLDVMWPSWSDELFDLADKLREIGQSE